MTIDIAVIMSIASLALATYTGLSSKKRNERFDAKKEQEDVTTMIVELKYISHGIDDIKKELSNVKTDVQLLRDRVIVVEQSVKRSHERINNFEKAILRTHERIDNVNEDLQEMDGD